jgi:hypothetical protein
MYKLHVIKPYENNPKKNIKSTRTPDEMAAEVIAANSMVETHNYKQKPTFNDMYKHICCTMIEMSKAYYPHYSNRKDGYVDIYFDEEFLMKDSEPNIGATVAWKKWQDKTGHMALPGSVLHGTVCVIQKEQNETT